MPRLGSKNGVKTHAFFASLQSLFFCAENSLLRLLLSWCCILSKNGEENNFGVLLAGRLVGDASG